VFITLEGGEGSGKSTIARRLSERLEQAGRPVLSTEEPTGTPLGRHVWGYFQDGSALSVSPLAELLLFEAARAQHVDNVIRPALAMGQIVICDRFTDSSIAYQGHGRGLSVELVERLNAIATAGVRPDLTLLLDVPAEMGLERAGHAHSGRGAKAPDLIGKESIEFHLRVHAGFVEIARSDPARVAVIDAAQPLDVVADDAWDRVKAYLEKLR
jgi:dTMP kinase